MNKIFYISWSTWLEGQIQTPWDFWYMTKIGIWKERQGTRVVKETEITHAYETLDSQFLTDIDNNYIQGVKLSAFVETQNADTAIKEIKEIFPDAEIEKCVQVTPEIQKNILHIFSETAAQRKTNT